MRTCVGCRTTSPATMLFRCALDPAGVAVLSRMAPGRGAWVCSPACFDTAASTSRFARAWRRPVMDGALAAARAELVNEFESTSIKMKQWSIVGASPVTSTPMKG